MKTLWILIASAGVFLVASPAAANRLVILPRTAAPNTVSANVSGDSNVLQIVQGLEVGGQSGNSVTVSMQGDFNGSGSLSPAIASNSLVPDFGGDLPSRSLIHQSGFDNSVSLAVLGTGNLFSFVQQGSANMASASISGLGNQASVQQIGQNNIAAFSQQGNGNIVSISQTSW